MSDYIYYRVYKYYFKWGKEQGITAAVLLSGFQSLSVLILMLVILETVYRVTGNDYPTKVVSGFWVFYFLALCYINEIYYSQEVLRSLDDRWKDEPTDQKQRKGCRVILMLAMPWITLIVLGILNKK